MSKKKKTNKAAVAEVGVSEVQAPVSVPAGIDRNPGVDPKIVQAEAENSNGSNGKGFVPNIVVQKADENKAELEIPVGGFNRNGMDALLTESIGISTTKVVDAAKPQKKSRIAMSGGYRGTVRQMLLDGKTGEEIVKAIAAKYMEAGKDEEYGKGRGKRILQDMLRDKDRGEFGNEQAVAK
jgi:hypothetical protein